jgi:membrane protein YdbS with pleckstrin-like domain
MVKIGLKELAIGAVFGAGIVAAVRRSARRYDLRDKTILICRGCLRRSRKDTSTRDLLYRTGPR